MAGFVARLGLALGAGCGVIVLLLALAVFMPQRSPEPAPPLPARWFDDRAGLVSAEFAAAKSTYLQSYLLQALHLPVLVVIDPKVPADGIEAYTIAAATAWKIGAQGADNGVLLFVFPSARMLRLEVGYGLEGVLPDVEAKRMLEVTLIPQFTAGRYEAGFEDFLSALTRRLQEHADEAARADRPIGIVAFAVATLRQVPRAAAQAVDVFRVSDFKARAVMAIFAGVVAGIFGQALSVAAIGAWALLQLPWRIATGSAWRALDRNVLAAELAPARLAKAPPPSLLAVVREVRLAEILVGIVALAGIVVGIAFLGLGSEAVLPAHGQFSGAGITAVWPMR